MEKEEETVVYECLHCGQKVYRYYTCPNCKRRMMKFVGPMKVRDLTSDIKEGHQ